MILPLNNLRLVHTTAILLQPATNTCFAEKIEKFQLIATHCIRRWSQQNRAAIAQWIRLRLPSCRPRFDSQANHLSFYLIYSQICAIFVIVL